MYKRQAQTFPTDDFVLVCDGSLSEELDAVIDVKQREMGQILNVVRLAKNVGLGNALNEGIRHCRHELVARMDSDDIAYPDRCEKQIAVFNTHSEVSICSGIVEEFTTDPDTVDTKRVPPETDAEIVEFAKKRNPFNHPCVMYKKSAVEAVGSYQDFYLLEDYYLWLRMLMAGYQGYNIQEPLLHMRAGSDTVSYTHLDVYKRQSRRRLHANGTTPLQVIPSLRIRQGALVFFLFISEALRFRRYYNTLFLSNLQGGRLYNVLQKEYIILCNMHRLSLIHILWEKRRWHKHLRGQ